MRPNLILQSDSYKLTHAEMYADDCTGVYAYLEARSGGAYGCTVWHGLQALLKAYLEGPRVTADDIAEAEALCAVHFAKQTLNPGWRRVVEVHGGRLPLRICAAPEGAVIPVGNVLMTVENTDPQLPWLTNAVESLLLKVWYPTTVATRAYHVRRGLAQAVAESGGPAGAVDYMLHDFGYRGVSSEESAGIGGCAHLLCFNGSDTLAGLQHARAFYGAPLTAAASVAASEHSVMTAGGRGGEIDTALRIIAAHPNQIVSLVADSFDYYRFVREMIKAKEIVDRYHVRLVIRPDSPTPDHQTPAELVLWTLQEIDAALGSDRTATGHKVIPYGVLWGDGLDPEGITAIVAAAVRGGFAAHNLVFGMGGGLLQKVNRDTCRFAIKCSAQRRNGGDWFEVVKTPLDASKRSKGGRLMLTNMNGVYKTWPEAAVPPVLRPVFENGVVLQQETFATIRARVRAADPV